MRIWLAVVGRKSLPGPIGEAAHEFLKRAAKYVPVELKTLPSEERLLAELEKVAGGRTRPVLLLADSTGKLLSSEEFAAEVGRRMDGGAQLLVVAIGPADGWTAAARARADVTLAFGRITLPHELAALVAAEQVYRALTIRAGHPYHSGH